MRPALLALALAALASPPGAAQEAHFVEEFAGELAGYAKTLEAAPPPPAECRAAYARLDGPGPLRIGAFFGFIDTARPNYVADGDFKAALVGQLERPCRGALQACGFAPGPGDPAAPDRTRLRRSLDGREVTLDVFDSSLSGDYRADVGPRAAAQAARSRLAEEQFLAALREDAVVLYAGHTRRFSGAVFHPPVAFSRVGAAGLLRRPFFARAADALRGSAAAPAVLGLFACHTRQYHAGRLHAAAPATALIVGAESSGHENNLLSLFGALNAVLARPCYARALASVNADGTPVFGVYGLFTEAGHPRYTRFLDGRAALLGLLLAPLLAALLAGPAPPDEAAWPARPPRHAWSGAALLLALLAPAALAAQAFPGQMARLPALLTAAGALWLAQAAARARVSRRQVAAAARQAWRPALAFTLLYLAVGLARGPGADVAVPALRQAGAFLLLCAALWPFALASEDVLLAPFAEEGGAGFFAACLHALVFWLGAWLCLCVLAPVYKPRLWPAAALGACPSNRG